MMKKLFFNLTFISVLLTMNACTSAPKKDTEGASGGGGSVEKNENAATTNVTESAAEESKAEDPTPVEKPKVSAPATPSQYDGLTEAIKSQSDDRIYTMATQILIQSPSDLRALNAMAMYHYKKGRFDVSKFLLGKAIAAHPKASELHSNLGVVLLAQNERREAIKSFRRSLELDNSDAVASANLGAIYVQEQDYNKALIVLETAYRKGMRDSRVLNNYGVALVAGKKYDKAEEVYKLGLKDQSSNKELLLNYAILLVDNLGKYQDGIEILNRLKFVGGNGESRNRIAALEAKAKAGVK